MINLIIIWGGATKNVLSLSKASKLRMTGLVRGFATGVKGTSEGQSHGPVVHLACWIGVEMGSITPSWLGTFEKRLNFSIESLVNSELNSPLLSEVNRLSVGLGRVTVLRRFLWPLWQNPEQVRSYVAYSKHSWWLRPRWWWDWSW